MPPELLAKYGLSVGEVGLLVGLVATTTALIKKHANLQGGWLLLASAVISTGWVALYYLSLPKEVAAAVFVFVGASGGWQLLKDMIGKVASGGTKPRGAGTRRID